MLCPRCQFDHPSQTTECLRCGVVFSRYAAPPLAAATSETFAAPIAPASAADFAPGEAFADRGVAVAEFRYRLFALPAALLLGYFVAKSALNLMAGMLAMVVHESGHAITAWLTGRWAIPMLWVTTHGESRSWGVVLFLASAILFGGYLAWKMRRWGWMCAAGAMLAVQIIFLRAPAPGALIVFGGDGGALVLSTILMGTFYASHTSKLYQSWGLRWGLLVIGALAFMHVFHTWSGRFEDIPFGEIEGVNLSDPSLLTEMYGWPVPQLIERYLLLARGCLAVLAALYIWGLISAYAEVWASGRGDAAAKTANS
jgi:hypothetical protein